MKNIPKICHMCWTKGSPLSLMQVFTVLSFHRYNPDWKIILYLSAQEVQELGRNTYVPDYKGEDCFYMIEELGYVDIQEVDLVKEGIGTDKHGILVSDILRVRKLYEHGGVYSDFDMIWLRPMSEFVNIHCIGNASDFETSVCFYEYTKGHHNASNIVSEPGGGFLKSVIEEQERICPPYAHQSFNSDLLNRVYPNFASIIVKFPRVLAMRYDMFYPYGIYNLERLYLRDDTTPIANNGVMGVHWFNGHILSREYADAANFNKKCSMSTILHREGLCSGF